MKKIFCSKCCHLADEGDLRYYNTLKFRQHNGAIQHGTDICIANLEVVESIDDTSPIRTHKFKDKIVDDPDIINRYHDCKFYKFNFFWFIADFLRMF